jgi:predicted nucleotidyltransferase component of viral defense system
LNTAFHTVIAANDNERRDLFLGTAARLGTAVQNVEKDFWVCWTLDALFNGLPKDNPRLLFKGGTSLSKAFGLIARFSEDIDITVFRGDLGFNADTAELEAMSGKKASRSARCHSHVMSGLYQRPADETVQRRGCGCNSVRAFSAASRP